MTLAELVVVIQVNSRHPAWAPAQTVYKRMVFLSLHQLNLLVYTVVPPKRRAISFPAIRPVFNAKLEVLPQR